MSDRDPAPRGTPRKSNRSMSWLVAGAAAVIIILVLIFWNGFGGTDEATIAEDTPVVEDQESVTVDEEEVVEETTDNAIAPEAAQDADVAAEEGPLGEAGEGVASGPESPLEGGESDEANEVADEAALENKVIEERADESERENSPVTDAQRAAEEIEIEADDLPNQ